MVAEVAQGDLDADALSAQAPGVADQAAYGHPGRSQAPQQGQADGSGSAGQEKHGEGG